MDFMPFWIFDPFPLRFVCFVRSVSPHRQRKTKLKWKLSTIDRADAFRRLFSVMDSPQNHSTSTTMLCIRDERVTWIWPEPVCSGRNGQRLFRVLNGRALKLQFEWAPYWKTPLPCVEVGGVLFGMLNGRFRYLRLSACSWFKFEHKQNQ